MHVFAKKISELCLNEILRLLYRVHCSNIRKPISAKPRQRQNITLHRFVRTRIQIFPMKYSQLHNLL